MIQTKKLIPEIYSQSYDLSIFTGLLDLVYTARELDLVRMKNLFLAKSCFDEDLQHLGAQFGLSGITDRNTLSLYRQLVKEKGTLEAVKSIALLETFSDLRKDKCILAIDRSNESKQTVMTAYVDFTELDVNIFETLLKKLAPVGTIILVRPLTEFVSSEHQKIL